MWLVKLVMLAKHVAGQLQVGQSILCALELQLPVLYCL